MMPMWRYCLNPESWFGRFILSIVGIPHVTHRYQHVLIPLLAFYCYKIYSLSLDFFFLCTASIFLAHWIFPSKKRMFRFSNNKGMFIFFPLPCEFKKIILIFFSITQAYTYGDHVCMSYLFIEASYNWYWWIGQGWILFFLFMEEEWMQIESAIMIHPFATWIYQPSFLVVAFYSSCSWRRNDCKLNQSLWSILSLLRFTNHLFLWLLSILLVHGGMVANWIIHYDPSFFYLDLPNIFFVAA